MLISKLPALFEVISIVLFIGSSALLFRSRYEKNETLVVIAGLVALLAFGYFVADLLGGRSSPLSAFSPSAPSNPFGTDKEPRYIHVPIGSVKVAP